MGRDSAHTQLPLNMPQVQVGLWTSSFFEGHVDSLRDTLSLAQTACQGSALFDHMRPFFVDGVTYLDLVMKGKVKSEVHSPKPRQAAKRPLPLKDIQLQLNFDHPPAAADLDLTDWFVREDVKPLEEELERARQHPLFELFFVEAKARIAADGDDEDWCFGDFNGCPDGDLEDFLEFLRRQHGISEAPAELGQPPIEAAPKPTDEAPPSADADPGQPPFEAAPKPADEAPPAAEADPGQPPFEAAPKPADEAPPAAEAEPGQPPFEAAPKLADEAPLGQPPEAAQQVAPCEADAPQGVPPGEAPAPVVTPDVANQGGIEGATALDYTVRPRGVDVLRRHFKKAGASTFEVERARALDHPLFSEFWKTKKAEGREIATWACATQEEVKRFQDLRGFLVWLHDKSGKSQTEGPDAVVAARLRGEDLEGLCKASADQAAADAVAVPPNQDFEETVAEPASAADVEKEFENKRVPSAPSSASASTAPTATPSAEPKPQPAKRRRMKAKE